MTRKSCKFWMKMCAGLCLSSAAWAQADPVAPVTRPEEPGAFQVAPQPPPEQPDQPGMPEMPQMPQIQMPPLPDGLMLQLQQMQMPGFEQPKMEKGSYLGLTVSPVSQAVASQLKLPPGVGLMIDAVEEGSPAAAAGIRKFDVIDKLDDQILINPRQLAVLVRMHKADDLVKVGMIHEGAHVEMNARLIEKDVPALDDELQQLDGPMHIGAGGALHFHHQALMMNGAGAMTLTVNGGQGQSMWSNGVHTLTLTTQDGKPQHLKAIESLTGNVLYDGPVATDDDRAKVPADVQGELKAMTESRQVVPPMPQMPPMQFPQMPDMPMQ